MPLPVYASPPVSLGRGRQLSYAVVAVEVRQPCWLVLVTARTGPPAIAGILALVWAARKQQQSHLNDVAVLSEGEHVSKRGHSARANEYIGLGARHEEGAEICRAGGKRAESGQPCRGLEAVRRWLLLARLLP